MFRLLAVVALVAAFASAGSLPKSVDERLSIKPLLDGKIINGEKTTIEKVPHQISIQYLGDHFCGGSIISEYWVVTAAHCLIFSKYTVRAGTADKAEGGSIHKVIEKIVHPGYGSNDKGITINDIGLIRVDKPFIFDATRKPIKMYAQGEETEVGSMSVITGWGRTEYESPRILNLVEVPIMSKYRCNELYSMFGGIAEGQICAAYEKGGKDACQGDSGGPLTVSGRLAGIVSWGWGCAESGHPGVYTEIGYYRDWIKINSEV